MAGTRDQVKGKMRQASGKTKAVVGRASGDRTMQAKGRVQQGHGKANSAVGKIDRGIRRKTREV